MAKVDTEIIDKDYDEQIQKSTYEPTFETYALYNERMKNKETGNIYPTEEGVKEAKDWVDFKEE